MVFSSITFLFYFLPMLLLTHAFTRTSKSANWVLLFFSAAFYLHGESQNAHILAAVIAICYVTGLTEERFTATLARIALATAVTANLALLSYFKYFNFLAEALSKVFSIWQPSTTIQLPLGISFFVFHGISYLVDTHRRLAPAQKRLDILTLYIIFFPQLVAGPIVRYHEIAAQFTDRRATLDDLGEGARRFIIGLSKKVLIANPLGVTVDQIFLLPADELSFELAWSGALLYSLQLYFDFSGYTDMAIGLARMFGFRFPENFNYPYISQSVQEFWRRWHITLSNWFRDYLYIPLGGNKMSNTRTYINLIIVFFLCGLWHGASWNFVVWGMWHGTFLVCERIGLSSTLAKTWRPIRHAYMLLVVMIGWIFFRANSLDQATVFLERMFDPRRITFSFYPLEAYFSTEILVLTAIALFLSAPFVRITLAALQLHAFAESKSGSPTIAAIRFAVLPSLGLLLSAIAMSAQTHNPFLYFRF